MWQKKNRKRLIEMETINGRNREGKRRVEEFKRTLRHSTEKRIKLVEKFSHSHLYGYPFTWLCEEKAVPVIKHYKVFDKLTP